MRNSTWIPMTNDPTVNASICYPSPCLSRLVLRLLSSPPPWTTKFPFFVMAKVMSVWTSFALLQQDDVRVLHFDARHRTGHCWYSSSSDFFSAVFSPDYHRKNHWISFSKTFHYAESRDAMAIHLNLSWQTMNVVSLWYQQVSLTASVVRRRTRPMTRTMNASSLRRSFAVLWDCGFV